MPSVYYKFVGSTLSTFDAGAAMGFYRQLFGWKFRKLSGGSKCFVGYQNGEPAADIREMPEKYRGSIPSHWTVYIRVKDVFAAADKVERHKGAALVTKPERGESKFSAVRDPSGARFTMYEGVNMWGQFAGRRRDNRVPEEHGWNVWYALHLDIDDAAATRDFYRDLFGWEFRPTATRALFDVAHPANGVIGQVEAVQEAARDDGKEKEYWMPVFAAQDIFAVGQTVRRLGGEFAGDYARGVRGARMFCDQQGAHFLVRQTAGVPATARRH